MASTLLSEITLAKRLGNEAGVNVADLDEIHPTVAVKVVEGRIRRRLFELRREIAEVEAKRKKAA